MHHGHSTCISISAYLQLQCQALSL